MHWSPSAIRVQTFSPINIFLLSKIDSRLENEEIP